MINILYFSALQQSARNARISEISSKGQRVAMVGDFLHSVLLGDESAAGENYHQVGLIFLQILSFHICVVLNHSALHAGNDFDYVSILAFYFGDVRVGFNSHSSPYG